MEFIEKEWAKYCNTTCEHGGICDLKEDHDGGHNAGGYCFWARSDDDHVETFEETVGVLQDSIKDLRDYENRHRV
jgi:hypothetical protein